MNSEGNMLDFDDLEQLTAFARCGTLSAAAEELHISQPTITRTMQRLEDDFGAPLFVRSKNSIGMKQAKWRWNMPASLYLRRRTPSVPCRNLIKTCAP